MDKYAGIPKFKRVQKTTHTQQQKTYLEQKIQISLNYNNFY